MTIYNGETKIFSGDITNEEFFEEYFQEVTALNIESDEECDYASIGLKHWGYELLKGDEIKKGFYFWSETLQRLVSKELLKTLNYELEWSV